MTTKTVWLALAMTLVGSAARADDRGQAREVFNQDVYGNAEGRSATESSILGRASKACGTRLEISNDFASMPEGGNGQECEEVIGTFDSLCSSQSYGPAVAKAVHKIECRYDGKHDAGASSAQEVRANMMADMELKNGVFIVHTKVGHANISEGVSGALERDLKTHHELQAAGILPYQIEERKSDNRHLYGDENRKTQPDSLVARANKACGFNLEVDIDYSTLEKPETFVSGGCMVMLEGIESACGDRKYKAILSKLHTLECRRDGKHVSSNRLSVPESNREVSKDMEIVGSRFIYHHNDEQANVSDALLLMLARTK